MAKLYTSEACFRVSSMALQIHYRAGYFEAADAERYFRDLRITTIYGGNSEVERMIIARQLLERFKADE